MPCDIVFHIGNTLALYGVAYDYGRLVSAFSCCLVCGFDRIEIMRTAFDYIPAESLELCVVRCGIHDLCNRTVNLESVEVDEPAKIGKVIVGCEHSGFPYLTFFCFTVAENCVNTNGGLVELVCKSHSA